MKNCFLLFVFVLLFCGMSRGFAQTTITVSMDWSTGVFQVKATHPLNSRMTPADHPMALNSLESELGPLIERQLGLLPWNNEGSLADLNIKLPEIRTTIKQLSSTLEKEWSHLSTDRKSIIAQYSVNIMEAVHDLFPPEEVVSQEKYPVIGIPVPEDPWTGIVIYAPKELPVVGTGNTGNPQPALKARILDTDLQVVFDSSFESFKKLSYRPMERREEIDIMVGRRPLRILARALYGEYPCDIILSKDDTLRIMASESGRLALAEGRIAILLDP